MKLNLGCGDDIREGWINIDLAPGPGVDRVWNLEETPLPYEDGTIDEIFASHVIEHLYPHQWHELIRDFHRMLRPGGRLEIRVPYGIGRHNSHTYHRSWFWPYTIDAFIDLKHRGSCEVDTEVKFFSRKPKIRWRMPGTWTLKERFGIRLPERYDIPIGYRSEIIWVLEPIKPDTFDGIR